MSQISEKKSLIKGNRFLFFTILVLVVYGSFMIASAEMGNAVGDAAYLKKELIKQFAYGFIGIVCYFIGSYVNVSKFSIKMYWLGYAILFAALISTRFFGSINGAYAWISFGSGTVQPSEFAKMFMILFGAKLFSKDKGLENINSFKSYAIASLLYVGVILLWQKDLGSAVVLLVITYCICLVPNYPELRKIQNIMIILMFVIIGLAVLLMTPFVTDLMSKSSDYRILRFVAAANPFLYQYDAGYHLIMSLVSFATGNIFGLGYGNSIHKYMNFPNPSSDFILPVVVEELGIFGFVGVIALYFIIFFVLIYYSIKGKYMRTKIVLFGTFLYFIVHFILNVGGVSGLIPLTGVPLLVMSAGGSSLISCLMCLGLSQSEIERNNNA